MIEKSGFFVLDKPAGISSARAIAELQRKLDIKKIGHAGTLDPFATGVLVVLVNRATRLAALLTGGQKCYRAIFRFGVATDSDDRTGKTIAISSCLPDLEGIRRVLPQFEGNIQQRPPRISAVKINGKRAYKRARADEEFEIQMKTVEISRIEIHALQGADLELSIWCGAGTYIRSLARDLGEVLGSCATVLSLCREFSSPFSIAQARSAEKLELSDLIAWDHVFSNQARVQISTEEAHGLTRGDERVVAALVAGSRLPRQASAGERILFELDCKSGSLGVFEFTGQEWKLWGYMGEL